MIGVRIYSITVVAALIVAGASSGCTRKKPAPPPWAQAAEAQLATEERPQNFILVTIDTLRADALGAYGGEWKTPHLDAFSKQGVVFENAFATAPFTGPSHASILSSRHPSKHGVVFNGHRVRGNASPDSVFVSQHLKDQGYDTGAVVSVPSPVAKRYGFARGFETYRQRCKAAHGDVAADGACIVAEARSWLEKRKPDKPFFLWVHLFDPHFPYVGPEEIYQAQGLDRSDHVITKIGVLKKSDPKDMRKAYLADVYEADHYFGELMQALVDLGLMGNTVVAVTSDHGEYLGEHGRVEHSGLYDEVLHVPLIVSSPSLAPSRRPELASTIDIVPTALDLLGLPEMESAQGRSIKSEGGEARPVFAEWRHFRVVNEPDNARQGDFQVGVRTEDGKLIVDWLQPKEGTMFFDLHADPKEERDLFDPDAAQVQALSNRLDEHIDKDLDRQHLQRSDIEIDPQTLKMLQALGYVE